MKPHEPLSPIKPESAASTGAAPSLLLPGGKDRRGDHRRIHLGLVVLGVMSVALLDLGIYQSRRAELVERRWVELERRTDARRDEIRRLVHQLQRQTLYVAAHPTLAGVSGQAAAGTSDGSGRQALRLELERTVEALRLKYLVLIGPTDKPWLATRAAPAVLGPGVLATARRARASAQLIASEIETDVDGSRVIDVAAVAPIRSDRHGAPVLVSVMRMAAGLGTALNRPIGRGPLEYAYLVRRDRDDVVFLTPSELNPVAGGRAPLTDRNARAAAMAATGLESNIETADARGNVLWATTRNLPELGWALVGEVPREAMLGELHATVSWLLVIDLAVLVCAAGIAWIWKTQYVRGLARYERRLTDRHAARVQAMFDTAFDAIFTFDRAGRVRTANHAAERMFGWPASEQEGQPLHRLLRWRGGGGPDGLALPTPGVVCIAQAMRADGRMFPVEFSVGQSGEGDDLSYTAIVRDVSERVEAEQRIRAIAEGLESSNRRLEELNAELQEASRLKSEFLANTSHELRTPLNGVMGFLQLVLDDLCENREEERDFLQQGLQCSRHLLGLINDVLDIAKIEAGKLDVTAERVDPRDLFDDVGTLTHVQAQQAGITLRFEPPSDENVWVRCDFPKTKQVLINLVGNAIKFTPKGSITVSVKARRELGHMMFEVVDTGIGIPLDRQQLIFEKFTQGDGSITRKYGGTGLGLAISRSLVELMGGIIGVHSDGEGRGTRMYFSLPIWEESLSSGAEESEPDPERIDGPANGPLVLVVEDDPASRRLLTTLLHKHGYRTVQSSHAEGAWMLVRRLHPVVVLLDYALPCAEGAVLRTGWDLAERMGSGEGTSNIPIIFVTGFDDELRDKMRFTTSPRTADHLKKPVESDVLLAKLDRLVGGIQGRCIRVLLADDDPTVVALARRVLPEGRFHVEVANNGEECLQVLRSQPRGFDLLLLDLLMPEVSGYDVLREMARSGIAAGLPVLVLTNVPEARNSEELRLLGQGLVLDVLQKTAVHENPRLLSHIIDWHVQVAVDLDEGAAA